MNDVAVIVIVLLTLFPIVVPKGLRERRDLGFDLATPTIVRVQSYERLAEARATLVRPYCRKNYIGATTQVLMRLLYAAAGRCLTLGVVAAVLVPTPDRSLLSGRYCARNFQRSRGNRHSHSMPYLALPTAVSLEL